METAFVEDLRLEAASSAAPRFVSCKDEQKKTPKELCCLLRPHPQCQDPLFCPWALQGTHLSLPQAMRWPRVLSLGQEL